MLMFYGHGLAVHPFADKPGLQSLLYRLLSGRFGPAVAVLAAGFMPKIVSRFQPKDACLQRSALRNRLPLYFFRGQLWFFGSPSFCRNGIRFSTPLFNSLVVNKSTPEKKGTNISFCTMAMFWDSSVCAAGVGSCRQQIVPGGRTAGSSYCCVYSAGGGKICPKADHPNESRSSKSEERAC